jgi:hypothetical protein
MNSDSNKGNDLWGTPAINADMQLPGVCLADQIQQLTIELTKEHSHKKHATNH